MPISVANKVRSFKQADFTRQAKLAMWERGTDVSKIARKLKVSRNAVSMAINHGVFGGVVKKVRKELGL